MKKSKAQKQKEREIIGKYYDKKMREILEPLYDEFRRWKKGEISHHELTEAIHKCHKENQKLYRLFTSRREYLLRIIEIEEKGWNQILREKHGGRS